MQDFILAGLRWNPALFMYSPLYCALEHDKYSFLRGRDRDHVYYVYTAKGKNNICYAVIFEF